MATTPEGPVYTSKGKGVYDSWDDLIADNANGYAVLAHCQRGTRTFTRTEGPYETRKEAQNAASRIRSGFKRVRKADPMHPTHLIATAIEPLWKRLDFPKG